MSRLYQKIGPSGKERGEEEEEKRKHGPTQTITD
jgi:hypothetical protein